jgi:DNA-binding NarL/FixJ family response regulator
MRKILIVDDSMFMRAVLADILSREYQIVQADSKETALLKAEEESPDLVLLDIVMPGGEEEGILVLKALTKAHPRLPVVMVTAVGQSAIIEQCTQLGAAGYIVKPFEEQVVLETVRKLLPTVPALAGATGDPPCP